MVGERHARRRSKALDEKTIISALNVNKVSYEVKARSKDKGTYLWIIGRREQTINSSAAKLSPNASNEQENRLVYNMVLILGTG